MAQHDEIIRQAALELSSEWEIGPASVLSEEALLELLTQKISAIISLGPDPFYRLMYRLDISEKKIAELKGGSVFSRKVAELVLTRQL